MRSFFSEVKRRNGLLYWFGWMNVIAAVICITMSLSDNTIVAGINAWIKPVKFYLSIAIFSWTMAWYLEYLLQPKKTIAYSLMVIIVMSFEMFVITWQASHGRLSHFNIKTPFYSLLFIMMGIAITLLVIWTAYITYLFFQKKDFKKPIHYIWAIRIALIIFVIYSFEGGLMAQQLSHSVGGADGADGLPLVKWNREYGDLRVAHFFGMHALQVIPLVAYYVTTSVRQVLILGILYFVMVTVFFAQAMYKLPVI